MIDRKRCYSVLSPLKDDGYIRAYVRSRHPSTRRWGFLVTIPDGSEYWFTPREALAFAEGVKVGRTRPGASTP